MTQMEPQRSERRQQPRYACRLPVHYENNGRITAMAIDLSDDGVSVATHEPLGENREFELSFFSQSVRVMSVVRNQESLGGGRYRIGMGFSQAQPDLVRMVLATSNARSD